MTTLKPFAEDVTSILIGELTIENGTDRIALYGSPDLARDRRVSSMRVPWRRCWSGPFRS